MSAHREIGGYLEFERFSGNHYHVGAVALNSGRGCIAYLIELRGIATMWVPDFMCDSVPDLLRREGVEVRTYPVGLDLLPDYDAFEIAAGEWMLLCDYYGQLRAEDVERALDTSEGRLAVDETQGFFRQPWAEADTLYTCRKWFGVADGGYLATSDGARLAHELPRDESHVRMGFVLGRLERPAGEFFGEASENNDLFAGEPAKEMSPITENILRAVNYRAVKARRGANWDILDAALAHVNKLHPRKPDGAFMYPLMVDGAQEIRRRLIEERIFVPCLWPNVLDEAPEGSAALRLARDVLPLPVDQRYGEKDMEAVIDALLGLRIGGGR